jgi:hypothetical protein
VDSNFRSFFSNGNAVDSVMFWNDTSLAVRNFNGTSYDVRTTQLFRDPAAWYHLVIAMDTTQATASNRIKIYVNGVQVTSFAVSTYPSQNYDTGFNTATVQYLGYNEFNYFDGYMTEVNFIDGQQLTPNSFGTFNSYGVWQPITYGGSYGTNGFYLPFPNNSTGSTLSASYLVVAGGGGGGFDRAGGGGAGGYRTGTTSLNPTLSYTITVGAGGGGSTSAANKGSNGNDSVFSTITSTGGGGGGSSSSASGANGGSGGGGRDTGAGGNGGSGNTPSTSPSQGNNGGNFGSGSGSTGSGGGGGGAGAVGNDGKAVGTGVGGSGSASSISGSSVTYAGGGGGGGGTSAGGAAGGSGGGGAGGNANSAGTAGTANLGAGGGGGGDGSGNGGNGGSGVVIVSYAGTQRYTGGTVTSSGGNTIHTFTSSGVLTSIFNDFSPNGNNWTGNNFDVTNTTASTYDSMTDVPTLTSATAANYAVLNPLTNVGIGTVSNGNLQLVTSTNSRTMTGSMALPSTGQYYFEITATDYVTDGGTSFGIVNEAFIPTTPSNGSWLGISTYNASYQNGTSTDTNNLTGANATQDGDIWCFAIDVTNNKFWVGRSRSGSLTWADGVTPAVNGSGASTLSLPTGTLYPMAYRGGSFNETYNFNFGQQPFAHTPPTGFVALNTFNL